MGSGINSDVWNICSLIGLNFSEVLGKVFDLYRLLLKRYLCRWNEIDKSREGKRWIGFLRNVCVFFFLFGIVDSNF